VFLDVNELSSFFAHIIIGSPKTVIKLTTREKICPLNAALWQISHNFIVDEVLASLDGYKKGLQTKPKGKIKNPNANMPSYAEHFIIDCG